MLLCIYILLLFTGLVLRPKSRLYTIVLLVFICTAMFCSHNVPDYRNYWIVYHKIENGRAYGDTGPGWYYLCKAGTLLGIKYRAFSIIIYVISLLLLYGTVVRYVTNSRNQNYIWTLYLLYPALMDAVQIRFFLAQAIILFGLSLLAKRDIKGYVLYGLLCFIATAIHTSAVFYFVFLAGPALYKIRRYFVGLVITMVVCMVFGRDLIYLIASLFVNRLRLDRYFHSGAAVGPLGFLAYSATLFLFWFIVRSILQKDGTRKTYRKGDELVPLFYQMSVLIWLVFPLTTFDTNFFRIQRPMWFMLYLVMTMMMERGITTVKIDEYQAVKSRDMLVAISALGFVFYLFAFNSNVIKAFLI